MRSLLVVGARGGGCLAFCVGSEDEVVDVEGDLATIRQLVWSKGDGGTGTEIRRLEAVGGGLGKGELEWGRGDGIEIEGEIAVVSADEGLCEESFLVVRSRIEAARFT